MPTTNPPIAHPWLDTSAAPLYRVTFPPLAEDVEVADYVRLLGDWWPRVTQRCAWVVDATRVENASAKQRKLFSDNELHTAPYSARYSVGMALAVRGVLVRGLITAIYWVAPPPYPYTIVDDAAAATAWAQARLRGEPPG